MIYDGFEGPVDVKIIRSKYIDNNRPALVMLRTDPEGEAEDRESGGYLICTSNLVHEQMEEGETAIKDYQENAGVLRFLMKNNIIDAPHRQALSGYVYFPICKVLIEETKEPF